MNLATLARGHMDGEQEQKAGTQRDRMREMIERRGGKLPDLTPEQQMDAPAQATIDLEAIAREEQQEMRHPNYPIVCNTCPA